MTAARAPVTHDATPKVTVESQDVLRSCDNNSFTYMPPSRSIFSLCGHCTRTELRILYRFFNGKSLNMDIILYDLWYGLEKKDIN